MGKGSSSAGPRGVDEAVEEEVCRTAEGRRRGWRSYWREEPMSNALGGE